MPSFGMSGVRFAALLAGLTLLGMAPRAQQIQPPAPPIKPFPQLPGLTPPSPSPTPTRSPGQSPSPSPTPAPSENAFDNPLAPLPEIPDPGRIPEQIPGVVDAADEFDEVCPRESIDARDGAQRATDEAEQRGTLREERTAQLQALERREVLSPIRREPKGAELVRLIDLGRELFRSTTAFGQQPSLDPQPDLFGNQISCQDCHSGAAITDTRTHLIPTEQRLLTPRTSPHLLGLKNVKDAGFGWDGRFACIQAVSKSAILNPTEMHGSRMPTQEELDAIAAFVRTLDVPPAIPGRDFDPVLAERGEQLFNERRGFDRTETSFKTGVRIACADCHLPETNFTDQRFHKIIVPVAESPFDPIDPAHIDPKDRRIEGFQTPPLRGVRFTAPYFHENGCSVPLFDPTGVRSPLINQPPVAALGCVIESYNERFLFNFGPIETMELIHFLLSL